MNMNIVMVSRVAIALALGVVLLLSAQSSVQVQRITESTSLSHQQQVHPNHISRSKFAYTFVIGGCNPDQPSRYRGYVYNILVSARMLRNLGSKADVVAFFQLSSKAANATTTLPEDDVRPLEALGVRIRYIPPSPTESFYEANMNKFHMLSMTEYERVLFMDGDVLPLTNLDYLFDLSMEGVVLKRNLVVAAPQSPSNGGFFMLAPEPGDFERVKAIICERENKPFDPVQGYGHTIVPPDKWETRKTTGTEFTFYGASADQGLLYHWVKYVKKEVSIVFEHYVDNYSPLPNGTTALEKRLVDDPLEKYRPALLVKEGGSCRKFMCDFMHFTGQGKPWLVPSIVKEPKSSLQWWWHVMDQLNRELDMGLDFEHWDLTLPSLGTFSAKIEEEVARRNAASKLAEHQRRDR